jgi:mono/diheme cytochrome c family protein
MKMLWLGGLLAAGLTCVSYASTQAPATPGPSKPTAVAGNVDTGKKLYVSYGCWQCHGYEGQGSVAGVRIAPRPLPLAVFTKYIRQPPNVMPPYTDKVVSDADLAHIHAYLQSRPAPPPVQSISILPK